MINIGDKIKIIKMISEADYTNKEGIVTYIDDANQIHGTWGGCIHTAQGLEFDYVGVLIGLDLRYDESTNQIIIDKSKISKDDKTSGIKSCGEGLARQLIKNTYKTLLTRGQKGCYIYCEDKALREYIKSILDK